MSLKLFIQMYLLIKDRVMIAFEDKKMIMIEINEINK